MAVSFLTVVGLVEISHLRDESVLATSARQRHFEEVAVWADAQLPANAAVWSREMAAALTEYSQRPILRWNRVRKGELLAVSNGVRARGYEPFALVRNHQIERFRRRHPLAWERVGSYKGVVLLRLPDRVR